MRPAQGPGTTLAVGFAALILFFPSSAGAQSWGIIDALGYGAAGTVAGVAATMEVDCGDYICGTHFLGLLGGLTVGSAVGGWIGGSADRTIARGQGVGGLHGGAVAVGTLLAGGALGGAASILLINPSGAGTFLGSDEKTVTILSLAGAGLGVLYLGRRWGELTGTSLEIHPTTVDAGRPGVLARLRF